MLAALLVAILLARSIAAAKSIAAADTIGEALQRSVVWHAGASPGAYAAFRTTFTPPQALVSSASLALFADSRYVLYVNGIRKASGPERFDWRAPTYDVVDVSDLLVAGAANSIVLLAHNYDSCEGAQAPGNMPEVCIVADPGQWWLDTPSGRFMNHVPGLAAALFNSRTDELFLATDASWRSSNSTRYRRSRPVWASVPDDIDGRVDGGDAAWERTAFDDSTWARAAAVDGSQWGPLTRRIIPNLRYAAAHLVELGGSNAWPIVLSDSSPSVVLDASQQVLASYAVALAGASAPGLVLSLTFFERRNSTTGLLSHTFTTSTYVTAGAPSERFETVDVFGGRYVQITLSGAAPFTASIASVNATDARYPFELVASFDVPSEPFFARLFSMAAATISINSGDSYTDCSTRERAEWLGDAVINLYNASRLAFATREDDGTTTYADARLLRGVLKRALLSARSFYPNFFEVKAHTSSDRQDFNAVWTDYSFALITGLKRYLDVSGDAAFVRSFWPDARALLLNILSRLQLSSGLGLFRETIFFTDPLFLDLTCGTTINAFAFAALADGAAIARDLGVAGDATLFASAAETLRGAIISSSWNSTTEPQAFNAAFPSDAALDGSTWTGPGGNAAVVQVPSAYANFVALAKGVLDADPVRAADAIAFLCFSDSDPLAQAAAPMAAIQQLSALFSYGGNASVDKIAIDVIRTNWVSMTAATDVGTLWEFFSESGEVSHNMGAAPLPFLLERVLGVSTTLPLAPNHRLVTIEPHLGDIMAANGVAVTEFGPVGVSWRLSGGEWNSGTRSVAVDVNASIARVLPVPAQPEHGTALYVNVSIAIPLADAATPPPPADALTTLCLELSSGGAPLNVSQALASGQLSLDTDRRYLRFSWSVTAADRTEVDPPRWLSGPALRGLAGTASLSALLSSPPGGCA
jgi:alpha-L-rhamnosidase